MLVAQCWKSLSLTMKRTLWKRNLVAFVNEPPTFFPNIWVPKWFELKLSTTGQSRQKNLFQSQLDLVTFYVGVAMVNKTRSLHRRIFNSIFEYRWKSALLCLLAKRRRNTRDHESSTNKCKDVIAWKELMIRLNLISQKRCLSQDWESFVVSRWRNAWLHNW